MSYIGKQPIRTALTSSDIEDGIITAAKIEDGAVVAAEIASNAVTTAKINADAVTAAKIADDVINSEHIVADSIDAEHYAAGSVDTTALGADAVTGAKIADDAINSEHYTDGSIDTAHLADGQVTTAKLATAVFTGATDIGAAIADADLFLMDDGAGGTIRKTAASRIKTYAGSAAGTLACSARRSSDLSLAGTTQVEVVFNQAAIDPDSKYNTSNGRYTPGVAGDYFVSYATTISHAAADLAHTELVYFKIRLNGTGAEFGQVGPSGADHNGNYFHAGSAIIQVGDSDDYISLWHYNANGNGSTLLAQQATMNIFRLT